MTGTQILFVGLFAFVAFTDVNAIKCYECLGDINSEMCRATGQQECREEFDACQTSVVNVAGIMTTTRSCAIKAACDGFVEQYLNKCAAPHNSGSTCYCCCQGDRCNNNLCGWCPAEEEEPECTYKSKKSKKSKKSCKKSGSKKSKKSNKSKKSQKSSGGTGPKYVKCGCSNLLASPLLMVFAFFSKWW